MSLKVRAYSTTPDTPWKESVLKPTNESANLKVSNELYQEVEGLADVLTSLGI